MQILVVCSIHLGSLCWGFAVVFLFFNNVVSSLKTKFQTVQEILHLLDLFQIVNSCEDMHGSNRLGHFDLLLFAGALKLFSHLLVRFDINKFTENSEINI